MTGQWLRSDTGTRWFFDSGALGLDFAYLGGFRAGSRLGPESGFALPADGSSPRDGLLLPADLDDWLAERCPGIGGAASDRELADARALRDAIARGWPSRRSTRPRPTPTTSTSLNLFAATARRAARRSPAVAVRPVRGGCGWVRRSRSVARDAVRLFDEVGFGGGDESRLRRCANPLCGLVYRDESRGTQRGAGARCSAAATGRRCGRTGPGSRG